MSDYSTPHLSPERLDQMAHFAISHAQEAKILPWYQRLFQGQRRLSYGFGAAALTLSCLGAFWLLPVLSPQPELAPQDITVSEYLLQDLIEDLG